MLANGWVVVLVLRQHTENIIGKRLQCGALFLEIIIFCLLDWFKCMWFEDFCGGRAINNEVLVLLLWRHISVVCDEWPALMLDGECVSLVVLYSWVSHNGYFLLFRRRSNNFLWFSLSQGLVLLLTWKVLLDWLNLFLYSFVLVHSVVVCIAYVVDFCELGNRFEDGIDKFLLFVFRQLVIFASRPPSTFAALFFFVRLILRHLIFLNSDRI